MINSTYKWTIPLVRTSTSPKSRSDSRTSPHLASFCVLDRYFKATQVLGWLWVTPATLRWVCLKVTAEFG